MERELRNAVQNHVKQQVMDAIVAAHADLDVPSALIGQEIIRLRSQMFQQFGGQPNPRYGFEESFLPDDMFKEQAERRVKLGFYCLK